MVRLPCAETAATTDKMHMALQRNCGVLHDYARRAATPPHELRLQYKFQSSSVVERCTLLAVRIFKATGAAGLLDGPSAESSPTLWLRAITSPINTSITAATGAPSCSVWQTRITCCECVEPVAICSLNSNPTRN